MVVQAQEGTREVREGGIRIGISKTCVAVPRLSEFEGLPSVVKPLLLRPERGHRGD
jgi:hypothetical protein